MYYDTDFSPEGFADPVVSPDKIFFKKRPRYIVSILWLVFLEGLADAVVSPDGDALCFGATCVLKTLGVYEHRVCIYTVCVCVYVCVCVSEYMYVYIVCVCACVCVYDDDALCFSTICVLENTYIENTVPSV